MDSIHEKDTIEKIALSIKKLVDLHQISKEQNTFLKMEMARKRYFFDQLILNCK